MADGHKPDRRVLARDPGGEKGPGLSFPRSVQPCQGVRLAPGILARRREWVPLSLRGLDSIWDSLTPSVSWVTSTVARAGCTVRLHYASRSRTSHWRGRNFGSHLPQTRQLKNPCTSGEKRQQRSRSFKRGAPGRAVCRPPVRGKGPRSHSMAWGPRGLPPGLAPPGVGWMICAIRLVSGAN
jgi:hypothetical protein